jgi:Tfp pilus assembly protein PilF
VVTLPVTPTAATFWMGLSPEAETWWGDGVTFRVLVDDTEAFSHHLTAEQAQAGWRPAVADLSGWAGQTVRLTLATDPGPEGDGGGDWAGWGDVRVVTGETEAVPWAWVRTAWEEAGVTAEGLIAAGEEARKAERYEEALAWYERAMWVAPESSDPWYYLGWTYEHGSNWEQALYAYQRAVDLSHFRYVAPSMSYCRMGMVYQLNMRPRRLDAASAAYERALNLGQFDTDEMLAECYFRLGQSLYWQRARIEQAAAHLEAAVMLHPNHARAHMMLGRVYYEQGRDFQLVEATLQESLRLAPKNKWTYYHMAVIYEQEGLLERALEACRNALDIDPQFSQAQDLMESLNNVERGE